MQVEAGAGGVVVGLEVLCRAWGEEEEEEVCARGCCGCVGAGWCWGVGEQRGWQALGVGLGCAWEVGRAGAVVAVGRRAVCGL